MIICNKVDLDKKLKIRGKLTQKKVHRVTNEVYVILFVLLFIFYQKHNFIATGKGIATYLGNNVLFTEA